MNHELNPNRYGVLTDLTAIATFLVGAIRTQYFCAGVGNRALYGVSDRDFLIARPGFTLVAVDYSQIELRIGAWFTRDPHMLAVYQNNGDIHAVTTAAVYGISLAQALDTADPEYKARRTEVKNINFGIYYGLYPRGLRDILRLKAGQNPSLEA